MTLTRPGNALMAAGGALAGALAAPGDPVWASVAIGMGAAVFGVAGGNALNDAQDAEIDRHAHPDRPIPRGDLTVPLARAAAAWFFALAFTLLCVTNLAAAGLGLAFILGLVWYEADLKGRGLAGNVAISVLVGGTFLLGALAAQTSPLSFASAPRSTGVAALVMALLAGVVNLAREVFKDLQDAAFDVAWRHTLPHRFGSRVSYGLARACLVMGIVLGLGAVVVGVFPTLFALLVLPSLSVFAVILFVNDPTRASFLTKVGMLLALFAFVAIALI